MGVGVGKAGSAVDSCDSDAAGQPTSSCSVSGGDFGAKVFAGYQFNRYLALEGGIASWGGITERRSSGDSESFMTISPFLRGFAQGVGTLPIAQNLGLFGRLGVGWTADVSVAAGLGLIYDLDRDVGIRLEAERFYVDHLASIRFHIDLLSTSLVFFFRKY